jgi:hypothetical protein
MRIKPNVEWVQNNSFTSDMSIRSAIQLYFGPQNMNFYKKNVSFVTYTIHNYCPYMPTTRKQKQKLTAIIPEHFFTDCIFRIPVSGQ